MWTMCICVLPVFVWFVKALLLRLVDLGGFTPEPTELAVLFALCGGMGTVPLEIAGATGSIALGFVGLAWTENMKQQVKRKQTLIYD